MNLGRSQRTFYQTTNRYEARIQYLEEVVHLLLAGTDLSWPPLISSPFQAGSFRYSKDRGLIPLLSKTTARSLASAQASDRKPSISRPTQPLGPTAPFDNMQQLPPPPMIKKPKVAANSADGSASPTDTSTSIIDNGLGSSATHPDHLSISAPDSITCDSRPLFRASAIPLSCNTIKPPYIPTSLSQRSCSLPASESLRSTSDSRRSTATAPSQTFSNIHLNRAPQAVFHRSPSGKKSSRPTCKPLNPQTRRPITWSSSPHSARSSSPVSPPTRSMAPPTELTSLSRAPIISSRRSGSLPASELHRSTAKAPSRLSLRSDTDHPLLPFFWTDHSTIMKSPPVSCSPQSINSQPPPTDTCFSLGKKQPSLLKTNLPSSRSIDTAVSISAIIAQTPDLILHASTPSVSSFLSDQSPDLGNAPSLAPPEALASAATTSAELAITVTAVESQDQLETSSAVDAPATSSTATTTSALSITHEHQFTAISAIDGTISPTFPSSSNLINKNINNHLELPDVNETKKKKKKKKKKTTSSGSNPCLPSPPSEVQTAAVGGLSVMDEEELAALERKNDHRYRPIEDSEFIGWDDCIDGPTSTPENPILFYV
ncbi:hypothetical protein MJO29_001576 [Puccinia striiformis f. sp. tritici]|uniref:Uncharacterized protein n=1 Tax=Puccinia striiformis f. sp. tritici PST-78 TaxID=1165861 RepID=A0A0L0W569_9BASI|nr:hypothetical protein Pst134EA_003216 [Puccinia striiformis f. sp. tritici]KAI9611373.1 hypothetical protein H4Q26_008323 [Puccinia striiformis f. sp. tritici PST-130]KNF06664.1 hypothetical protein PSTG_00538 [Puccinia striiformis f. sp. tritici PST-78]KAH9472609.1 hypothetical protein Pst134EA_003216 [Puccinia striiformis f. sp. tritici]KAI7936463.1 hypothetical protein MJO29_015766 [Puccinia striiformis f. sp. tritici]KAI7958031.1 hypothetical protein MJO29_006248 [Puccinia striiformis f.